MSKLSCERLSSPRPNLASILRVVVPVAVEYLRDRIARQHFLRLL